MKIEMAAVMGGEEKESQIPDAGLLIDNINHTHIKERKPIQHITLTLFPNVLTI